MKSLQSLAEMILSPIGLQTDMYEIELIKQRILSYRQLLIQQDFNRTGRYSEQLVQAFDLKLTEVEEDNDKFYISEILPKPILIRTNNPFFEVHTSYKGRTRKPLGFLSIEEIPYIEHRKFTNKGNFYSYENSRIVVFAPVNSIRVRAIWDNPLEVSLFAKQETFKLACSDKTISSPCTTEDDVLLEETLAARILTFFNSNNANNSEELRQRSGDRNESE